MIILNMIFMYLRFITWLFDIHIPREMMTTVRLSNISCVYMCVCVCVYVCVYVCICMMWEQLESILLANFQDSLQHYYFVFFHFIFNFNWRIIALQCCVGFCCTIQWISHKYTYLPSLNLPSTLHPTPLQYYQV